MNTNSSKNQPHWLVAIFNVVIVSLVVFFVIRMFSYVYINRFLFIRDEAVVLFWSHMIFGFLITFISMIIFLKRLFLNGDTNNPIVWTVFNRFGNLFFAVLGLFIISGAA